MADGTGKRGGRKRRAPLAPRERRALWLVLFLFLLGLLVRRLRGAGLL